MDVSAALGRLGPGRNHQVLGVAARISLVLRGNIFGILDSTDFSYFSFSFSFPFFYYSLDTTYGDTSTVAPLRRKLGRRHDSGGKNDPLPEAKKRF